MKYFYYGVGYLILMAFFAFLGYGMYILWNHEHSLSLILFLIWVINIIFSSSLFVQKRHSQAKVSWFMIMFFLPIIGQILYLIFGQRYKYRKTITEYRSKETFKYEIVKNNYQSNILHNQSNISGRGIYDSNIELFGNINEAYSKLFSDMDNAKSEINIHFYIIKRGEIFEHFKYLLIKKAKQGLKIRLIVDDFGRWGLPWYKIRELEEANIEVGIFGKVYFPFISSSNGYRTHRKMVIIDNKIVHTGGINLADEYASLSKQYGFWIDYQTRITGPAIKSFVLLFIDDWQLTTTKKIKILPSIKNIDQSKGTSKMVLVEDSPEITLPILQDSLVSLIINAKKTIEIISPYLVPSHEIVSALRLAAFSGVKVSLYIPGTCDKKTVFIATHAFAKELMSYGIKIYEFENTFVHSKFGIFDNEYAYFGTANIDMRSLYSNCEIISVVSGKIVNDLNDLLLSYKPMTRLIEKNEFKINPIKERMVRTFVNLFSPIM